MTTEERILRMLVMVSVVAPHTGHSIALVHTGHDWQAQLKAFDHHEPIHVGHGDTADLALEALAAAIPHMH